MSEYLNKNTFVKDPNNIVSAEKNLKKLQMI